jgi:hypothetical protein
LAATQAKLRGYIQMWQSFTQSLDGLLPVFAGEQGPATSGAGVDDAWVNGNFLMVQAVDSLTTNQGAGSLAGQTWWVNTYNGGNYNGGDALTNQGTLGQSSPNILTPYGQQVRRQIAAAPPTVAP